MTHPFHGPAQPLPLVMPGAEPAQASERRPAQTPFVAEMRRSVSRSGSSEERYFEERYFVPSAALVLTPALRAGGLWHALPGEEIKTLLLVLTFLTPDGACRPALAELAPAMRLPEGKARARLERLAACRWQGAPVIRELRRESGLHAFTPAPDVLCAVEAPPRPQETPQELEGPRAAGREAVIAYSRARYARPRAEVEREMALRMGWEDADALRQEREREEAALTDGQRDLLGRLLGLGVERARALEMLAEHAPERIRRQVEWLPLRGAKNPARFLAAAIQGDYAAPAGQRTPSVKQEGQTQEGQTGWAEEARTQEDMQQESLREDGPAADREEALPTGKDVPTGKDLPPEQALPKEQALPTLDARALPSSERPE